MKITLKELVNSTFRFYINNNFRHFLFSKLKLKYGDWRIVARNLDLATRHLFGLRRGWEIREGRKLPFLFNVSFLIRLSRLTNINLKVIQKNITHIKYGQTGKIYKICLPLVLKETKKFHSIESILYDYKYFLNYLNYLESNHKNIQMNKAFLIEPKISRDYLKLLSERGLSPKLDNNFLSYRIPGTNKIKTVFIPEALTFDENFSKQFGKWIGDRCGGERKIGVANKNYLFVKEFEYFIKNTLNQIDYDFYLTYSKTFTPTYSLKKLVNNNIKLANTQYGDYAFRVEVSNAFLKREVFDIIEKNLLVILLNSNKRVRYAYYAGLIEAEGSVNKDKTLTIAFGADLKKFKDHLRLRKTFNKAIELYFLLKKDGFNPRLSRKTSNTYLTNTLKYDINLLISHKTRRNEVKFINKTICPFITHSDKLRKIRYMWR